MSSILIDQLKMLELKHETERRSVATSRLKVYYGWARLGKVRKKESISVIFENEAGVGSHHRMGKTLTKLQETVFERFQTVDEAKDAGGRNRVFTEYSIMLDDPKINGSLERALHFNSMSDKNHVSQKVRSEIAAKLRAAYYGKHPGYKEPTRQLELFDE